MCLDKICHLAHLRIRDCSINRLPKKKRVDLRSDWFVSDVASMSSSSSP